MKAHQEGKWKSSKEVDPFSDKTDHVNLRIQSVSLSDRLEAKEATKIPFQVDRDNRKENNDGRNKFGIMQLSPLKSPEAKGLTGTALHRIDEKITKKKPSYAALNKQPSIKRNPSFRFKENKAESNSTSQKTFKAKFAS